MIKLYTQKKKDEIEVLKYFAVDKPLKTNKEGIKMYFEWSEQGKHKTKISAPYKKPKRYKCFNDLYNAKTWRGVFMEMYEEGVLDLSMPYYVILGGYESDTAVSRPVVEFMKKEMFKGKDANIIENCYQEILKEKI